MLEWWRTEAGAGARTGPGTGGDYLPEMTERKIDDLTAEALLAGRPVPPGLEPLARVVAGYRRAAWWPVPPGAELAAWMATGGLPDAAGAGAPAVARNADSHGRPCRSPARKGRRRKRMPAVEVLAGVAAKLAGMSVAAKAVAGLAVVAAGVSSAGLAGALPDPAQERFESVVETVTPVHFPEPAGGNAQFGERVSEDAKDGGVDGAEISEEARQLGEGHRPAEPPAADRPAGAGKPSELPTPDRPGPPELPPGPDDRPTPPGR